MNEKLLKSIRELISIPCHCNYCWTRRGMHDPQGCTWEDCKDLREAFEILGKENVELDKKETMRKVVIESPYAGDIDKNISYAKLCVKDCLSRGEAPYASHLFYTQPGILDDLVPAERKLGIEAGFVWGSSADFVAVYIDNGISNGMRQGIKTAKDRGAHIDVRSLQRDITEKDYKELEIPFNK